MILKLAVTEISTAIINSASNLSTAVSIAVAVFRLLRSGVHAESR